MSIAIVLAVPIAALTLAFMTGWWSGDDALAPGVAVAAPSSPTTAPPPTEARASRPTPVGTQRSELAGDLVEHEAPWDPGVEIPNGVVRLRRLDAQGENGMAIDLRDQSDSLIAEASRLTASDAQSAADIMTEVLEQYSKLFAADLRAAAAEDARQGRYIAVSADGSSANRILPTNGRFFVRMYNGGRIDDGSVDIVFSIRRDDPRIAPTMEAIASIRSASDAEAARAFNAKPLAERKTLIEQHDAAVEEVRRLQSEFLGPQALKTEYARLVRLMLPSGFRINRTLGIVYAGDE